MNSGHFFLRVPQVRKPPVWHFIPAHVDVAQRLPPCARGGPAPAAALIIPTELLTFPFFLNDDMRPNQNQQYTGIADVGPVGKEPVNNRNG